MKQRSNQLSVIPFFTSFFLVFHYVKSKDVWKKFALYEDEAMKEVEGL